MSPIRNMKRRFVSFPYNLANDVVARANRMSLCFWPMADRRTKRDLSNEIRPPTTEPTS